ncbi:MAG: ribosome maturation factor RimM [Alphaproteobacteria bacterium]|nr:ribosome maturation factor RimM [Alphaproteobacteria bacterium]
MATIGAPFGVRGCFRLKTRTEHPENALSYGPLTDASGKFYQFKLVRIEDVHTLVVSEANTPDRTAAEGLRGIKLFTDQQALPEINTDTDDDALYCGDLIGLEARDADGNIVGTVENVENYGASDILIIKTAEGLKQIAFILDSVLDINIEKEYLVIVKDHLI